MQHGRKMVFFAFATAFIGCNAPDSPVSPEVASRTAKALEPIHSGRADVTNILSVDGGVTTYNSGYGSALALVPGTSRDFYMLTDRGPNIDFPMGNKGFPVPSFNPRIVRAHLSGNKLRIDGDILLRRADGTALTGIPIGPGGCGATGEKGVTLAGVEIPADPSGIDSEGLVAMNDGSFWISDEYGPFLAHFAADGRALQRLSPCNGGLPAVYRLRRPNRGMEGLTLTPDGQWLVGIMQSPLENPGSAGVRNVSQFTRILFKHIASGATKEYGYLLESAGLQGNSEILALSNTRFLVIERDGNYLATFPTAFKRIYEADVSHATDVSTMGALGATPIAGGKTLEQATVAQLQAAGIVTAAKTVSVDLAAYGFAHDKPEGLALAPGNMLFVVNDDDFGIVAGSVGVLGQKLLPPTSIVDFVELWQIKIK